MHLPDDVQKLLNEASKPRRTAAERKFTCEIFGEPWNQFVELWAPRIYDFLGHALSPFGKEPKPNIEILPDGQHSAGATASFSPDTGQIRLSSSVEDNPGQTLEKLTHEMTHASLNDFPEGDPFYEEGFVDYSVWVMAHAPLWEPYRNDMIKAAASNIAVRRDRALKTQTDYDRKRWAGGLYASVAYGPYLLTRLRQKKIEGNLTW